MYIHEHIHIDALTTSTAAPFFLGLIPTNPNPVLQAHTYEHAHVNEAGYDYPFLYSCLQ